MSEPITTGAIAIFFKGYIVPAFAILMGSVAYALQEVKKHGWRGTFIFSADIFIALVAGNILYQFISIWMPSYAILSAALGGYLGPNSVRFVVTAVQANLPARK